jgi:release factor glutamine methyltransferase
VATWRDLRERAEHALGAAAVPTPDIEARWMLVEVSGYSPAELVVREREPALPLPEARLDDMLRRRRSGEPLQYVLGSWSFRGVDLMVDRRVLVPRPETEVTAQVAIDEAVRLGARTGRADPWRAGATTYVVADLGTGSGAIALALATELPDAEVWATDRDPDALVVARANAAGLGHAATRVRIGSGDWFGALPDDLRGRLRLVVSNPPYVAEHEFDELPPEVAGHEPRHALVSGPTGLEAIDRIAAEAATWLAMDGVLVCELAPHQATTAVALARAAGFDEVFVRPDLAGRERVLVARCPAGRPA